MLLCPSRLGLSNASLKACHLGEPGDSLGLPKNHIFGREKSEPLLEFKGFLDLKTKASGKCYGRLPAK
jgi:hypothetical protein